MFAGSHRCSRPQTPRLRNKALKSGVTCACGLQTEYLRMYTTEAAKKIPDNSLDFVYVDARCGRVFRLDGWVGRWVVVVFT